MAKIKIVIPDELLNAFLGSLNERFVEINRTQPGQVVQNFRQVADAISENRSVTLFLRGKSANFIRSFIEAIAIGMTETQTKAAKISVKTGKRRKHRKDHEKNRQKRGKAAGKPEKKRGKR